MFVFFFNTWWIENCRKFFYLSNRQVIPNGANIGNSLLYFSPFKVSNLKGLLVLLELWSRTKHDTSIYIIIYASLSPSYPMLFNKFQGHLVLHRDQTVMTLHKYFLFFPIGENYHNLCHVPVISFGARVRYHFDGSTRKFFEGWYFKVSIPECRQSFCFMYAVENPAFRTKLNRFEEAQHGPRSTGVAAQILGADDKYICQCSDESQNFWGSMFSTLNYFCLLLNKNTIFSVVFVLLITKS